ncbi:MAG: RnfABCDGE type electron transport complex subunit D [Actinobacteria bacterium]|nr:RnfABCDGE type electron transport complex subunit D [Actinomycetota bacterium]
MEAGRFIVSTSPHIRDPITTRRIMCHVIAALAPVTVYAVVIHGIHAFYVLVSSIAGAMLGELAVQKGRKLPVTLDDCSALLTGLLLALTLPPQLHWWIALIAGLVATVLGKQMFGGLGHNLFNPALVGRAVAFVSWASYMNAGYAKSASIAIANTSTHKLIEKAVDVASGASPLAAMKIIYDPSTSPIGPGGVPHGIQASTYYKPLFLANPWGCLGEVSALLLILGGVYLVAVRIIDWKIPVIYVGTVAVLTSFTGRDPLFYTLAGGLLIGAVFMATDYTTSPLAGRGKVVYALGLGLVTWLLRFWSNNPEGVMFAILFMNGLVPIIDRYILPRTYGTVREARKTGESGEAAAS